MTLEESLMVIMGAIKKCKRRQNVGGINICGNGNPCQTEIATGRCETLKKLDEEVYDPRQIEFLRRKSNDI